ncbi:MAG: FecR domain-containing protein, partial [Huintestinicola sp.]
MRSSEMTKKTGIIIGAAAAVVVAAAVITVMLLSGKNEAYRVIKIFDVSGKADVERSAVVLDAYKGMNLESGDVLSVREDSTARISLDGDKFILLDRNTVLEMKAEGTASDSRTTINLVSGTILNELTQPLSANSVYEVNTPKATMAVRGTEFTVSVTPLEDGTYVTDLNTLHGNVAVQLIDKDGGNKGEEVQVPPGMAVTIKTEHSDENKEEDVLKTGNSFFVVRAKDAPDDAPPEEQFIAVGEDEDPVYEADYSRLSDNIKLQAVKSDTEMRTVLEDEIVERLMSSVNDQEALAELLTSPENVGRPDFTAATGTPGSAPSSDMSGDIPDETGEAGSATESDNAAETNIPDETVESASVTSVTDPTETEPTPAETAVPEEEGAEETVTASAEETGADTDSSDDAEETESETSDTSENEESETEALTENTVPEETSVNMVTDISDVSVTGSGGGGTPDIPQCTVTFMLEGSELSTRTVNIGSKLGTLP